MYFYDTLFCIGSQLLRKYFNFYYTECKSDIFWAYLSVFLLDSLFELSSFCNTKIRGWIGYDGRFYDSDFYPIFKQFNTSLFHWANRKQKKIKGSQKRFFSWLKNFAKLYLKLEPLDLPKFVEYILGLVAEIHNVSSHAQDKGQDCAVCAFS